MRNRYRAGSDRPLLAGRAWGDLVFVSGQLAPRGDGISADDQPFEVQARQTLANLLAILATTGFGPTQVLRVTAYVAGIENWPVFDRIYTEVLGAPKSAR